MPRSQFDSPFNPVLSLLGSDQQGLQNLGLGLGSSKSYHLASLAVLWKYVSLFVVTISFKTLLLTVF